MLVTYGFHPREDYSVEVAHAIEKMNIENVMVRRYDWPHTKDHGNSGKVLRETKANWLVDLHSNQPESKVRNPPDEIDLKSSNLGSIGWGYQHDYYSLMKDFFDKYYAGKEILANFDKVDRHLHARVFQLGLLWYRPIEKSIEFVQNFADYLKSVQC